jgi:peptidoglycan/xylan/chitin deacetylase (PgdA/CDA1 family)
MPSGEDYFIPPMAMSVSTFSKLTEWLARLTKIVDLSDAAKSIRAGTFQGRAAAITFDDGYKDNFDLARKILKNKGIPATFFIPVYPIDNAEPYWWDQLYNAAVRDLPAFIKWLKSSGHGHLAAEQPLKPFCRSIVQYLNGLGNAERLAFLSDMSGQFGDYEGERLLMSWDEIRQMHKQGFSIGSHSLSHIPLTDLTQEQAKIEIEQSKAALSEKIGAEISGFCYPRGAWTPAISEMTKDAGYAYSVTTMFGSNTAGCNLYGLARRNMSDYQGLRAHFPIPSYLLEMTGILDRWLSKRR